MKSFFVMIEAGKLFDENSQLYKFRVGTSKRDRQALNVVVEYAEKHGYYIAEWSLQTRDFVIKLARSVNRSFLQLNWLYMDVTKMASCIKSCNYLPKKHFLSSHEATVRRMLGDLYQK